MKSIGLTIAIGASVAGAIRGIGSVRNRSEALGNRIAQLNKKKLEIIANDKSVVKLSQKFDRLDKRITYLKKKKIELQAKISTAKSQEEITALKDAIAKTSRKITAMNNNRFKIREQLKEARSEAEQTNSSIAKIGRTIRKINGTKLKIEQTVEQREKFKSNMIGHVAKVATVAMPIKTGIEFESSMARVKAITMATDKEFKALEGTALKLGSSTTFTSSEVAQGMQYLSMAGLKTNQTIKAMPGVLNLASAGAVDLATTSDIASNVLSGFRLKAEKMTMVSDVMAKAITTAHIDVVSLGETMKYAATPAESLGDSIQTVTALTAKLGDIGIKGSEAGTALRSMYLRMASPPKEAQKIVKKLGLTLKDSKGNFVGMSRVLQQLHKKTKGMGNTVKADYMKKLFGTEAVSAAIALTDKADGTLKKYTKTLENSAGTAQKIADIQNNTTAGALKRLSSAVEGIAIKFSKIFTPAINLVANKLSGLSNWIGRMMEEHGRLTKYLVIGATAFLTTGVVVGGLAVTLGFALNGLRALRLGVILFNPLIKMMTLKTVALRTATIAKTATLWAATGAIRAYGVASSLAVGGIRMLGRSILFVGRALLMNPIGLAATAIAGTAYLIYDNWSMVKEFFTTLLGGVKGAFNSVLSSIKNALSWSPLGIIVEKWNPIVDFFNNINLFDAGKKIIGSVVDGLSSTWGKLTQKVGDITKSIRDFFPFSPAKKGALRDIHRIKLFETVASGLNEKPLLKAVNNTTTKVRKGLLVGGTGLALSGAVAQTDISKYGFSPKELSREPMISKETTSSPSGATTINISFGETHIHTPMEAKEHYANIEATVARAIADQERQRQSVRMYD